MDFQNVPAGNPRCSNLLESMLVWVPALAPELWILARAIWHSLGRAVPLAQAIGYTIGTLLCTHQGVMAV